MPPWYNAVAMCKAYVKQDGKSNALTNDISTTQVYTAKTPGASTPYPSCFLRRVPVNDLFNERLDTDETRVATSSCGVSCGQSLSSGWGNSVDCVDSVDTGPFVEEVDEHEGWGAAILLAACVQTSA